MLCTLAGGTSAQPLDSGCKLSWQGMLAPGCTAACRLSSSVSVVIGVGPILLCLGSRGLLHIW